MTGTANWCTAGYHQARSLSDQGWAGRKRRGAETGRTTLASPAPILHGFRKPAYQQPSQHCPIASAATGEDASEHGSAGPNQVSPPRTPIPGYGSRRALALTLARLRDRQRLQTRWLVSPALPWTDSRGYICLRPRAHLVALLSSTPPPPLVSTHSATRRLPCPSVEPLARSASPLTISLDSPPSSSPAEAPTTPALHSTSPDPSSTEPQLTYPLGSARMAPSPPTMAAGSLLPRQDAGAPPPPVVSGNGTADATYAEPLAGRVMSVILALASVTVLSVFIG